METIGERIRKLRDKRSEEQTRANGTTIKFTQQNLADAMDVTRDVIKKWEKDEVCLNSEKIVKLADFFNVSTDYLLRGGDANNLVLMNETGLPESTIQALKNLKHTSAPVILSKIIEHRLFSTLTQNIEILCQPKKFFVHMSNKAILSHVSQDLPYVDSPENLRAMFQYSATKQFETIIESIYERKDDTDEKG